MEIHEKLAMLGQAAQYDDCILKSPAEGDDVRGLWVPERDREQPPGRDPFPYVSHVQRPDGRRVALLKVLQTSACQHNCNYCAFRAGRDLRRERFLPDELARSFDLMYRAGVVEGMFLSSGIIGAVRSMDQMLATAELVRRKYGFHGYLHLKILPGSDDSQVLRAIELADRVSVNLEAPNAGRLAALAPQKRVEALVGPLRLAGEAIRRQREALRSAARSPEWGGARLGMSTQFVVGPAGESDRELLSTTELLYRDVGLARAYYSAFTPVRDTPLEGYTPTDPRREHRIYQADFLLKRYGFAAAELPYDDAGALSTEVDPKTAWARIHPERFPLEVNRASLDDLLRVPGIGPHSARAILTARQQAPLREVGDLRKLGARAEHAAPYIMLAGRRPPHQLRLPLP